MVNAYVDAEIMVDKYMEEGRIRYLNSGSVKDTLIYDFSIS